VLQSLTGIGALPSPSAPHPGSSKRIKSIIPGLIVFVKDESIVLPTSHGIMTSFILFNMKEDIICEQCGVQWPWEQRGMLQGKRRQYVKFCTSCASERYRQDKKQYREEHKDQRKMYYDQNRDKARVRRKQYNEENKETLRDQQLQKKYGVDLQWYREVYNSQLGVCAICGEPETKIDHRTGQIQNLAIDHDHKTGQVRRLLCWRCNSTIGKVGESPDLLWKMIMYLKAHGAA
jgi:hypothetical protein